MEAKAAKSYRIWKKETLANQTGHHKNSCHNKIESPLIKKKQEEVVVRERNQTDGNQYSVELAEGWRWYYEIYNFKSNWNLTQQRSIFQQKHLIFPKDNTGKPCTQKNFIFPLGIHL